MGQNGNPLGPVPGRVQVAITGFNAALGILCGTCKSPVLVPIVPTAKVEGECPKCGTTFFVHRIAFEINEQTLDCKFEAGVKWNAPKVIRPEFAGMGKIGG